MKLFVVVALVAAVAAEPEADPLLYSSYGYSMPYTYSGYKPYTWPYTYSSWPYTTPYHHLGKREAEAEPEADPALLYSSIGHLGYSMPYTYSGYKPYTWPYTYSSWPYTTPYHHLGKREAEAEPEPEADPALLYSSVGHLGYSYPYSTYSGYKPYTWPYTYSSWPYTTPYHHLGKREAEAEPEADPALLYTSGLYHTYSPYTYSLHRPYVSYPYTTAYSHWGYYG
jgi:hypothetical protein